LKEYLGQGFHPEYVDSLRDAAQRQVKRDAMIARRKEERKEAAIKAAYQALMGVSFRAYFLRSNTDSSNANLNLLRRRKRPPN